jgi:hypothetical protein
MPANLIVLDFIALINLLKRTSYEDHHVRCWVVPKYPSGRSDDRGSIPAEGCELFSSTSCPDRLWVKRPGREAEYSPPSSAEFKECVEIYLHSPNTSSCRGA